MFCWKLNAVWIPKSIIKIDDSSFNYCKELKSINVDKENPIYESVSGVLFNKSRTSLVRFPEGNVLSYYSIPNSVIEICENAFRNTLLKSVTLPIGIKKIGYDSFGGCELIATINIPVTVEDIKGNVFKMCKSLMSINVDKDNPNYSSVDGILYNKDLTEIIAFPGAHPQKEYEVQPTTTEIGNAFQDCENITKVIIPFGVTQIPHFAFCDCKNLITVSLPYGVSKIGYMAFMGCCKLSSIDLPKSLIEIDDAAFMNSGIKEVRLTGGLKRKEAQKLYAWDRKIKFKTIKGEDIQTPLVPRLYPVINIVDLAFVDDGNNKIDANEHCFIKMKIKNTGKGAAIGCVAKMDVGGIKGLTGKDLKLPNIAPGKEIDVSWDLLADGSITDGEANIKISVIEPHGFSCDPTLLSVSTQAFVAPKVQISDYSVTGAEGGFLSKRIPFDLQVLVQNAAHGIADDIDISITVPQNVFITEGEQKVRIPRLIGGETQSMVYSLIVNNNYTANTIPVQFTLKEKHGKYAENRTINLAINQSFAQNKIEVKSDVTAPQGDINIASISGGTKQADVDLSIPENVASNRKTFAVVIANENYRRETAVKFASNDGNIVSQYMTKTLGLPAENVHFASNATLNEMRDQIDWLKGVAKAYNGDVTIILYYAGHGMPDEATGQAYLIPCDGNSANPATCIALNALYEELAVMNVKRTCVFLDACFSGAQRGDGMLMAARGVAIKPKNNTLSGKMVVFSAAQGTETAYPYQKMGHGLFTYYLLKKLQETKGNASLGELGQYITNEVSQRSIVVNGKSQTPTTAVSSSMGDEWKSWKLK